MTEHPLSSTARAKRLPGAILNETTGAYYADIQSAIDTANAGDVIAIPEGEFSGNLTVDVAVTLKGAGADKTTIKFDKTMRGTGVEHFDGRIAYPTIYATADVTIEGLTIACRPTSIMESTAFWPRLL